MSTPCWEQVLASELQARGKEPRLMQTAKRRFREQLGEQTSSSSPYWPRIGQNQGAFWPTPANLVNLTMATMLGAPIKAVKTVESYRGLVPKDVTEVEVFEDGSTRVRGTKPARDVLPAHRQRSLGDLLDGVTLDQADPDGCSYEASVVFSTSAAPAADVTLLPIGTLTDENGRPYRLEQRIRCIALSLELEAPSASSFVVFDTKLMACMGELARERVRLGRELGVPMSQTLTLHPSQDFRAKTGPEKGKADRGGTRPALRTVRSTEKEGADRCYLNKQQSSRPTRPAQANRGASADRSHPVGGETPPGGIDEGRKFRAA